MKVHDIFLAQVTTLVVAGALASAQTPLPPDPKLTCTVSQQKISKWFAGGAIVKNGLVNPAPSDAFPAMNTDCDFYKWASQMFLWLNSPTGPDGGRIFDSDIFFDVSPQFDCDSNHQNCKRTLIPNSDTEPNNFALRSTKPEEIGETGQAGSNGALMSQAGSLVYYGIHVNDVYAWFRTGQKGGDINETQFPTTPGDLNTVEKFAHMIFPDREALTMEVKTSWVAASTVADASRFVTIQAVVPKYDVQSPTVWKASGTETIELALVGMHIVGSVKGHPEMIWATYEHVDNAPNDDYYYTNSMNNDVLVPYSSQGSWLFMQTNGSKNPANVEFMAVMSGNIEAKAGHVIEPSNTYRVNPWGSAPNSVASAVNNTCIISINDSVLGWLVDGDVRKNYHLHGAIWTQHGNIPPAGTQKGSLKLANSTLETYFQGANNPLLNCFDCHNNTNQSKPVTKPDLGKLSHIYQEIIPLSTVEEPAPTIPTVSTWGLGALALMLALGARFYFGRRHQEPTG